MKLEKFAKRHHHKMELLRTFTSFVAACCTVAILVLKALGKF